ncbi:hypothetical protein HV461_14880 [Bacillus sporothermodurans]|uniref:hypothetical protein n=1 Tax=Heyndrickxia TaxID=2837504 RepID=UPI001365588C|nr:hypothetical protein [Heyndrickxia sporothermodurans]MBL5767509.1 hypothetical protein [Heyndrickxia sporothermodurans]MBL5770974.1 hypothetical protein [Heyndrickxia sporothermodurans]MBL5811905.1 hypothetical protein [Heyndrickxia sporothermodurans]MBL5830717.1 hypothetical protein [Heyndrickxia sporothermodurans]MBL5849996.1 hypothetical protein [Heyndrickxia sporothermodurans]
MRGDFSADSKIRTTEFTHGGTYWSKLRTSVSSKGIARAVYEADNQSTNAVMVW